MTARTTREWLDLFLAERRLKKPDGRLLYDYRTETAEYLQLVDVLKKVGDPGRLRLTYSYGVQLEAQRLKSKDRDEDLLTMPAFVLYASEWFRREWDGKTSGVWARVMNQVAWDKEYGELYPAMASGLGWWHHRFIEIIKTQYLGTFAYQSGKIRVDGLRN